MTTTNTIPKRILLLEDDEDWASLFTEKAKKFHWKIDHFDKLPPALAQLQREDVFYDIVIADKGGTGRFSGKPDAYGHRDGLLVLQESKRLHPDDQLRVLSTGETWNPSMLTAPNLGLHAFFDKGMGDYHTLFDWMEGVQNPSLITKPLLFSERPRLLRERGY